MAKEKWPKAIFYDSKNTLWDWGLHIWADVAAQILKKHQVTGVDPKAFANKWHAIHLGYQHRNAFADYREFKGCHTDALMDVCRIFGFVGDPKDDEFMDAKLAGIKPYPDTIAALKAQQKLTKVFTFSNVEQAHLESMVAKLEGFKPDFVGTMQLARMAKPNPQAYLWTLKKCNLDVKDVIYCAGPMWDVQGAMAAGMKAAHIKRPGEVIIEGNDDGGVKPQWEIKSLHELTKIVESFLKM